MKNKKFLVDIETKCGDISNEILNVGIDAEQTFKCKQPYCHLMLATSTNVIMPFTKTTIYGRDSENLTIELHAWFKISVVNERTSFKLPSNCKAWSIFPRTKYFSTTMLRHDG